MSTSFIDKHAEITWMLRTSYWFLQGFQMIVVWIKTNWISQSCQKSESCILEFKFPSSILFWYLTLFGNFNLFTCNFTHYFDLPKYLIPLPPPLVPLLKNSAIFFWTYFLILHSLFPIFNKSDRPSSTTVNAISTALIWIDGITNINEKPLDKHRVEHA